MKLHLLLLNLADAPRTGLRSRRGNSRSTEFGIKAVNALIVLPILALGLNSPALANTKELSRRVQRMPPITDCQKKGLCELKNVRTEEIKYKVILPNEHSDYAAYMTDFRFVIETEKTSDIPKFGLIQTMRGCMWEREVDRKTLQSTDYFTYIHKNFGQTEIIKYQDWIVDAEHADPVITSFEGYGRFDLYRWNPNPRDLDANKAKWWFHGQPPHSTVFKATLIGSAGLHPGERWAALNQSLEFRTCLFKISDLPATSDKQGTGIDMSKAVWCADWEQKYHYDFTQKTVVPHTGIHPVCSTP